MKKLIIFGQDDFAQVARFYFDTETEYEVIAYSVEGIYIRNPFFDGLPVVNFDNIEEVYSTIDYEMFIAIGYSKINEIRKNIYYKAKEKGYKLASFVSKRTTYYPEVCSVGDNCFIFEDNTIQPFTSIGNNVVLWSGNHLGHHSIIKDHVFVTSHVVISGRCVVGEQSFLGVNAAIADHIVVADRNVIGAGTLIKRNTLSDSVYSRKTTELYRKNVEEIGYFNNGKHKD